MLDTDTKRHVDTARDILVGKVPDPKSQVEQITIALIPLPPLATQQVIVAEIEAEHMIALSDFKTELEVKVAQQLKSQRVGYLLGAGSSYWHLAQLCGNLTNQKEA